MLVSNVYEGSRLNYGVEVVSASLGAAVGVSLVDKVREIYSLGRN